MFGVFYAKRRESIQRYLEAGWMPTVIDCHLWNHRIDDYGTLFAHSRLLTASTKTSTYICTLKTQSN